MGEKLVSFGYFLFNSRIKKKMEQHSTKTALNGIHNIFIQLFFFQLRGAFVHYICQLQQQ